MLSGVLILQMEIRFVYPEMTADEFMGAVEDLNSTIEDRNALSFMPRAFSTIFAVVMFIMTAAVILLSWKLLTFLITGRDTGTVYVGLLLMVLVVPAAFSLQKKAAPALKKLLLKLMKLHDYEEKFTFLEHADREDEKKRVDSDYKYYRFCDEVRSHKIVDASIDYDGNECEVDISFNDEETGTGLIRRIRLPVRIVSDLDGVVVDFERRCVCCPATEEFV